MELRSGYKLTDVGVIPVDWETPLLDSVAKRGSGHTPDKAHPEYWGGSIKWISLQDTSRLDQLYIYDTAAKITLAGIANSSAKMHAAGTVVMTRDAGVGKSAIMADDMAVSQHFMAWACGSLLNNHYLYYWLQARKSEFERIAMGNTIKTIGLPYFKKLTIPLPTKVEQEAIAEVLSNADALIESLDQLIAKKRHIKQGTMQELLTGKRRLPGFERKKGYKRTDAGIIAEDWILADAGSIGRFKGGCGFPIVYQGSISGEYPFFKVSDMNNEGNESLMETANNYISEPIRRRLGAYAFPAKTIVFAKVGAAVFLERKKILTRPSCIDNNMAGYILSADGVDHRYIHFFMLNFRLGSLVSTTALPSLSGSVLNAIKIPLPPTKAEQETIAGILSDMGAEIAALESKLAKTRQIKQGMMHNLLTGRIRLV
jgi:type I restriction enzyme S subunit